VSCEDGTCTSASRLSKMVLWLVAAIVVAVAAFPYYSGAILKAQAQGSTQGAKSVDASETTVVIPVSGMTCDSCATHIQGVLSKSSGVKSAVVSYEKGQATVTYDPQVTSVKNIQTTIEAIGYRTGDVERSEPKPEASTAKPLAL
jgi:mercuric ion transport protein